MRSMDEIKTLHSQLEQIKRELNVTEDNVIGIFLYGSQNYGLSYEGSDVDSITIIHSADRPIQTLQTSTGLTKVITLDRFIRGLKYGDLEFYEILYTKFKIIAQPYETLWASFIQEFSNCMSYERLKRSLYYKLDEHLMFVRQVGRDYPNTRYNKKRLYWAIRVCNQLTRLNEGEKFETSLIYHDLVGYDLLKIKTIPNYLSPKEYRELFIYLIKFIKSQTTHSADISDEEETCLATLGLLKGGRRSEYT